ncbi:MAG: hypothetical protein ACI4NB_09825, partial [Candidatus Ornithospirochaeta sp.]
PYILHLERWKLYGCFSVKLNKDVTKLGKNVAKLTKMQSNMEKLLAEQKLADEEKERLKEKLRKAGTKNNRVSSYSKKPKSPPKRSVTFSD